MATQKQKLFALHMLVDETHLFDIMAMLDGKVYDLKVSAAVRAIRSVRPRADAADDTDSSEAEAPAARSKRTPNAAQPTQSMADWAREYITRHRHFRIGDVIAAAVPLGYTKGSAYGAMHILMKEKRIKRVDDGEYVRVDKPSAKAKTAKKVAKKAAAKVNGHAPGEPGQTSVLVLEMLKRGPTSVGDIRTALKKNGFSELTAHGLVSTLLHDDRIIRVAKGTYALPGTPAPSM